MKKAMDSTNTLNSTHIEDLEAFLAANKDQMITGSNPFSSFMRSLIKSKGLKQQDVFIRADIPDRYGYKLISRQKHTRQRDVILRICYSAGFTLDEVQEALRLYEMPQLYIKIPRDVVLMFAFQKNLSRIGDVNELLTKSGFEALHTCGSLD